MRWRPQAWATLLAAALAAAGGCRKPPSPSIVRIGHEGDVITLDPAAVRESVTHSVLSNIYESLVAFDKDMRLVPALAVNWNTLDERTWVLELRKGVRFHDGRPFTASDVKASLERAREPASGVKGHLSTIRDVEVVGEMTVKLRTLGPDPLLLNRLTYLLILPGSPLPDLQTRPVGTGPYRFVRWEKGQYLEAEAYDGYWGGKPPIDRVRFVPVEEGPRSLEVFRKGEVEVLRWAPETLLGEFRSIPGVGIASRPGMSTYYLWLDSRPGGGARNPLSDRRVRQALSMAIDRRRIIERLGGSGVPAYQLVQQGVFGYVSTLPAELPFDPESSRRLLHEAGYPQGFDVALVHRSQASVVAVSELIQTMLGSVGIRLKLETPEWPTVVARWQAGELPFFIAGWRFESGDAASFLRDCLYTRDPDRNSGGYNPGYSNPELDRLIDENDQIFGDGKRLKHYEKLMQVAMGEMPLVPLYHRFNLYGVSRQVRWQPRLDGKILVSEMALEPR